MGNHSSARVAFASVALALGCGIDIAAAQDDDALEEITVTGTRIRRTEYESTTAVQSITAEDMERLGLVSAADMLAQMPSNVGQFTLDTTGEGAFFVGDTFANLRGMNTFFGTRTLTLVDGQRFVTTTNGGGVGMSFIPSILIGRMETVTGGASATYGSDATAGVVNVILDRNVQGMRLDASYGGNESGDFKNYSVAMATGIEVLDGRGDVTVSIERQVTDPVGTCAEVLEYCERSMGIFQNYRGTGPFLSPIPEANIWFPDADWPAWQVLDGARFLHTGNTNGVVATNNKQAWSATNGTFYQFTPDGTDIVPWQESITDPFWREFAYSSNPGSATTVDERTRNVTVYGVGENELTTNSRVLRNGQERENIFTRFVWDVTDDIRLNAQVSWGETIGMNTQNSENFHQSTVCIYLPNRNETGAIENGGVFTSGTGAALRDWGGPNAYFSQLTPQAQQLLLDRGRNDANATVLDTNPGQGGNQTSNANLTCTLDSTVFGGFGLPGVVREGAQVLKNWRGQVDRGVSTETSVERASVGLNGSLFGGSWTWNTNLQIGVSDRFQQLRNNQTNFRYKMALDSVVDPNTGEIVCRVKSSGPEQLQIENSYIAYFMGEPITTAQIGGVPGSGLPTLPGYASAKERFDALSRDCVPLNPFGLAADPAAIAYAWDDLTEFSESDQGTFSASFSGDFWKGVGAGPWSMAAGLDYRDEETINEVGGDPNRWIRTDFGAQYGDPWTGGTKATEIFAEFELPLVRDRAGADYLMVNLSGRRTKNNTFREGTADDPNAYDADRYGDSWRASFVWQPIGWMRIRATKSADIRSPAPRELFYRQTFSASNFGGVFAPSNPWRTVDVVGDQFVQVIGSNPNLRNEQSNTNTLGFVFTPGGWAQGLQLALDYNHITVTGGIAYGGNDNNDANDACVNFLGQQTACDEVIWRCYEFADPYYCGQIEFNPAGSPEEPNTTGLDPYADCVALQPCAARSDIISVTSQQWNREPYWTNGFDLSANYRLQLDGGGGISMRLLASKALEQMRCAGGNVVRTETSVTCTQYTNFVGVTGSDGGGFGSFLPNYQAQPEWSGNIYASYSKNAFTITGQARYTGAGVVSLTDIGPEDPRWAPELYNTRSINSLPSWVTWNLTTGYNFSRSRFAPERWENLQVSLTIDNLLDKNPQFWSSAETGGVNRRFFPVNGRTFRLNFRSAF